MPEQEPSAQDDDAALAQRMIEKDERALVEVLKRYGPKIKGYLKKQFGDVLDGPERDFVFNQAAMNLWKGAHRFDPKKGSMRGWFIRIARNAAVSHIRGQKKFNAEPLDYDPADDTADECGDVSPVADSKEQRRLERIDDFIRNKLVGDERTIALNCFTIGGDPDSARLAAKLGKSRGYVDTVKSKVKKKIREAILALEAGENVQRE